MSEDLEALPDRERARVRSRDRKVRGPKVVVDNAGLRKLALERAEKLRRQQREGPTRDQRPRPGEGSRGRTCGSSPGPYLPDDAPPR